MKHFRIFLVVFLWASTFALSACGQDHGHNDTDSAAVHDDGAEAPADHCDCASCPDDCQCGDDCQCDHCDHDTGNCPCDGDDCAMSVCDQDVIGDLSNNSFRGSETFADCFRCRTDE